jgi:hypothetical protein
MTVRNPAPATAAPTADGTVEDSTVLIVPTAPPMPDDTELAELVAAWPSLPEPIRKAIRLLVGAAKEPSAS